MWTSGFLGKWWNTYFLAKIVFSRKNYCRLIWMTWYRANTWTTVRSLCFNCSLPQFCYRGCWLNDAFVQEFGIRCMAAFEHMGSWKSGNPENWDPIQEALSKYKSVSPKMLARSGLAGEILLGPFGASSKKKWELILYVSWWANGPY